MRPYQHMDKPEDRVDHLERQIEIWKANHKDAINKKRGTEARLRAALDGLQAIYTLCVARPDNADPEAMLKAIHRIAGDAFEKATTDLPPNIWGTNQRS